MARQSFLRRLYNELPSLTMFSTRVSASENDSLAEPAHPQCYLALLLAVVAFPLNSHGLKPVAAQRGMVVSSEAYASHAGVQIMQSGGNAVDAAVAVGFALAVTYPFAGNLGGGGFMVVRLANGDARVIDYREEAPAKSNRNMYLDAQARPVPGKSTIGGLSVAVPGTVAGLVLAEQKYGKLGLERVMQPSIRLAYEGFAVDYWLSESLKGARELLGKFDESRRIFLRDGNPYQPGEIFKQPELGKTLQLIAQHGSAAFYTGATARAIAATVAKYQGILTEDDLKHYEAKLRNPLVGEFRGYDVVTVPPPSSGGVLLLEMLNVLEPLDLEMPDSFPSMRLVVETMRRAYADRAALLGDADFVHVPVAGLISPVYAAQLRKEILAGKPDQPVQAGNPMPYESEETTHFSVVDAEGNAVSNTYTLNGGYGSGVTAEGAGFLLNDQMDDFAAKPGSPNMFGLVQGEANAIVAYKRPLSSMTPTIVLQKSSAHGQIPIPIRALDALPPVSAPVTAASARRDQSQASRATEAARQVRLVLGSPGGGTIPNTVLQVLLNTLVFRMDVLQAVNAPRFHDQWLPDKLTMESTGFSADTIGMLRGAGYQITNRRSIGECEAIEVDPDTGWRFGAADPRGDGKAVGY